MKQSIQAQKDVRTVLVNAGVESVLTGSIRLNTRKLGSTKEDVVINTLYWDGDQVQSGILNVNIHVPNLAGQVGDNPTAKDNTQPNITRFQQIAELIIPALQGYSGADFLLHLRQPGKLENYGTEWLYNIEVEYIHLRNSA